MSTPFDDLTALRDQWMSLQPLSPENESRLWRKLRLEWNYHSNHIEGNTLTYGETELLLLHDRTTGNHSHREFLEMKAHDLAIEHVRKLAADSKRIITEGDIRDLNKIILKESFWKVAETADGKPTRKEIVPGQYKTTPNNVRTANGEMFFFASVEDTPPKMTALAGWLGRELESPTLRPVALAAKLHHDFVLIHPFDDGNGRVARLLANYVLMRCGCLPLIVRTEDKANYLTALRLADAGDLSPLVTYFHRLAEWSLHLGIKAAKGESIEEPADVEKELAIFIRNQQEHQDKVRPRSVESVRELFDLGLKSFLEKLESKLGKLKPLFARSSVNIQPPSSTGEFAPAFDAYLPKVMQSTEFLIQSRFEGFRGQAPEPFGINVEVRLRFDDFNYRVNANNRELVKKLYSEPILTDEAEELANRILAEAFERIKKLSGAQS